MNNLKAKDYISSLKPIWCPGCGDYGVLNAIAMAFEELSIPPEKIAVISGIGCSSRLPGYLNTYGFNSIHGRALPIACGLKIARDDLTVIAVGGDGDGFSIGGGHLSHAIRRNVDISYFIMDNQIYGLTKGQASPTTPFGDVTSTTSYGNIDTPIWPISFTLGYGATFVAQSTPLDIKHLATMMVEAIKHPGFAFVNIISPCVTYRGKEMYQYIRDRMYYIDKEEGYDPKDLQAAWRFANDRERIPLGVFYKKEADTYRDRIDRVKEKLGSKKMDIEMEKLAFVPDTGGLGEKDVFIPG